MVSYLGGRHKRREDAPNECVEQVRGPVGKVVTLEIADPTRSQTNKFTVKRGKIVIENNRVVEITDP